VGTQPGLRPEGSDAPTIGEIGRTVLRLEFKLDEIARDHETRLRRTERWVYAVPLTIIGSLVTALTILVNR
jgi:hypothetical protein